ncbi:MAG: hypothetical protein WCY34_05455 [Candidatus Omnitrophota bacterium]|jgi:transcriptional regulator of heat shock response
MVKGIDTKEREEEILGLVVDSYIKESRPISSAYLCQKHRLDYSSATVRNILLSLENQGLLSHIHTSSGRVPTQSGFRRYVGSLVPAQASEDYPVSSDLCSLQYSGIEDVISHALDTLTKLSGYISLVAVSGENERMFFKGMRFMFEQPEFEDLSCLKNIFYVLEVRMEDLQDLLLDCVGDNLKILIGDEIGFQEIPTCSLVVSGLKEKEVSLAMALLGPMRMNYTKASSCLHSVKRQLQEVVEDFI